MSEITQAPGYNIGDVLTEQEVGVLEARMRKFQSVGYNPDPVMVRRLFNTIRKLRVDLANEQELVKAMQREMAVGIAGLEVLAPNWLPSMHHEKIIVWFKQELERIVKGLPPDAGPKPEPRRYTKRGRGRPRKKGLTV